MGDEVSNSIFIEDADYVAVHLIATREWVAAGAPASTTDVASEMRGHGNDIGEAVHLDRKRGEEEEI